MFTSEYIPLRPHNVLSVYHNISRFERVAGDFFRMEVDEKVIEACLDMSPGKTNFNALVHEPGGFINIETRIHQIS